MPQLKTRELRPIKETPEDFEAIEAEILKVLRQEIFLPLLRELGLGPSTLKNAPSSLVDAIRSGRLTFYRGRFQGKLNATLTKELKALGAKWDRTEKLFRIGLAELPDEIRAAVEASEVRFFRKLARIDEHLSKILLEKISGKFRLEKLFDATLWKADKDFEKTLEGITIAPKLTDTQRERIAAEYTNNLQLYIKDFTEKEVTELRQEMKKAVFAGNRYESAVKTIQARYGVTERKAKFLARQETSLMITKFKQTRYQEAGVNEYKWGCVVGSAAHPVRPMHKRLEGTIHTWDNPPIVDEKGNRKNPGQDYNCRCFAKPIVRFK